MSTEQRPVIYLSGPMSGLPECNYPAFHAAAARLRALGYRVENPAENPTPACGGTWEGWMRLALRQMLDCDAVAWLPGWMDSRGALLECQLALQLGMPWRAVDDWGSAS